MYEMALPIAPTPILEGKEAGEFLKKLERELKDKKPLVPRPRLGRITPRPPRYDEVYFEGLNWLNSL